MAMEIYERHSKDTVIYFLGINKKGYQLAKLISEDLERLSPIKTKLGRLLIQPESPLTGEISMDLPATDLRKKTVIVVDDVMNTGRTLFYSFKCLMDIMPKSLEVCVLVLRMHKSFPVNVDYYGLRLATTIKQNIEIIFDHHGVKEVQMF
jgi:pyrimidine operon attenuation protein/uracil phosphoribosyltransferase